MTSDTDKHGRLTPSQFATIDAWRDNFHPDALADLERLVKAAQFYNAKGGDSAGKVAGLNALLEMARELAVRG